MNRIITLVVLAGLSTASLAAQDRPLVISSMTIINDMAKNIGGELFRFASLLQPGTDPHTVSIGSLDTGRLENAALILVNGLSLEDGFQSVIDRREGSVRIVSVSQGVATILTETYPNRTDPHAWMTAGNALIYAQNIRDALIGLSPDSELEVRQNYDQYRVEIEKLDQYITRTIAEIPPENRIIITYHDAFSYYAQRYNLKTASLVGLSTASEPQFSGGQRLENVISSTSVPALFVESHVRPDTLQKIAMDRGIVIGGTLYAGSLSDDRGPAASYLSLLRYNTDLLREKLVLGRHESTIETAEEINFNWLWILVLAPIVIAAGLFIFRLVRQ